MAQFFSIHPDNPQQRLLREAVKIVQQGGVIVYPTDSCYALGCHLGDKQAMERIMAIRQLDLRHHFTLVCRDLSELGSYAKVDNVQFRQLKAALPGPYTFILQASKEVPPYVQAPAGQSWHKPCWPNWENPCCHVPYCCPEKPCRWRMRGKFVNSWNIRLMRLSKGDIAVLTRQR